MSSSRIIRGDDRIKKVRVTPGIVSGDAGHATEIIGQDHVMNVEKQAFEQGYKEGERIGKQMGERMMETTIKRYERSVQELANVHRSLVEAMETETVHLPRRGARRND